MSQHANATTTPEMRAFIRESDLPTAVLARLLKISEATVRKWRERDDVDDAPHTPKTLNTTLSPAQEYVMIELRTRLLLSLDELLTVCKEFINPQVSRAGLQRCLKRHGVSRLADVRTGIEEGEITDELSRLTIPLKANESTEAIDTAVSPENIRKALGEEHIINVEMAQLPEFDNEANTRRLLIASDPESRWVYVDIYEGDEKEAATRYMTHVLTKAPFHIRRILAGNYNEFLNRFSLLDDAPDDIASDHQSEE